MEYTRFDSKLLMRLDPGEEIVESMTAVCSKENIQLGVVSGIGAVNKATVGLFNPVTKEYFSTTMEKDFEVTNLTGNVSQMNGEVYLHLHATLADLDHNAFGGHLNAATVSATAEIWIDIVDGAVDREFSETIGLNLLKF
ncbi:DNA-binding protein [Pseudodesulfovibrio profundus]|uniref:DNA-binding protein n=1 Tax=Pseudodesulfovibrio profundus TaxID=57320 RepID=A0A2C8FAJ2_9BACT|nr:PPC domain-containing DNA-binding protein [Pseudodesulfovibrio profundus]MBC17653.1 DNA-binding protein [Desulfovibrio sp.]SOB59047.1 DNA-binding protein [Pseudodesulfovibrio profundus]|tara:strand:+ start:1256 stop:1675 length:420 start_codon:yes stop_codon:yes gene_type:complete